MTTDLYNYYKALSQLNGITMLISHFNLQYQLVKVEGCSYISMCIKKQVKLQYTVSGLERL